MTLNGLINSDLTTFDLFLSCHLKGRIFTKLPTDLDGLRTLSHLNSLVESSSSSNFKMLASLRVRAKICIDSNGGNNEGYVVTDLYFFL